MSTTKPQTGMTDKKSTTTSGGFTSTQPLFSDSDKYSALASLVVGVVAYSQGYEHYILASIGASIVAKVGLSYYDSLDTKATADAHASIQTQHK
jgi:hypothetical protein